jgi:maltose O-acetyltransferase
LKVDKAVSYVLDIARAQLYLRQADEVAADVRVVGRPRVRNDGGRLVIGPRAVLRSIVAPVEITVGPGATMIFGRGVHLNSGSTFAAFSRVELGDRVEVAPHVTVYDTSFHSLYERTKAPVPRPVIIEDDVWLGTKCTVLPGVRIGRGAVVMANTLVTRNVEPFTIVSGVPAQPVADLDPTRFIVDPTA